MNVDGCMHVYMQIADFGMSRDLMDENYYTSHGGMIPVKWTAPEVFTTSTYPAVYIMIYTYVVQALHYKKYSTASDVWSYGAIMYEIWSVGHKPFENQVNSKVSLAMLPQDRSHNKIS